MSLTIIYIVGWLDRDLKIDRVSWHDCPAAGLTRKFRCPPPVDLGSHSGPTREAAFAEARENAEFVYGTKLGQLVVRALP